MGDTLLHPQLLICYPFNMNNLYAAVLNYIVNRHMETNPDDNITLGWRR